jgi:hypothetical protein
MARRIAPEALIALEFRGRPFHDPFHGQHRPPLAAVLPRGLSGGAPWYERQTTCALGEMLPAWNLAASRFQA